MDSSQPTYEEFLQHVHGVINLSQRSKDLISIPNLLLPGDWLTWETDKRRLKVEDAVLNWLLSRGFQGDRTRRSPSYLGYPEIFKELIFEPPWVNIEFDDIEGNISPERAQEIEPLYLRLDQDDLEEKFEQHLHQLSESVKKPKEFLEYFQRWRLAEFQKTLSLARMLGPDLIWNLAMAVFDEEVLEPAKGAPDLFIWTNNPSHPFWFFAEIKGPRDHLRPSQYDWIVHNWESVQGHIVVISVFM